MRLFPFDRRSLASTAFILSCALTSAAQASSGSSEGPGIWPLLVGLIAVAGCVAFIAWYRRSSKPETDQYNYENRLRSGSHEFDMDEGLDADKELEWLRKAKKPSKKSNTKPKKSIGTSGQIKMSDLTSGNLIPTEEDTKSYQERLRKQQFANLPINSFLKLTEARDFVQLPLSGDQALLSAIEQANEEFEDDEAVRELALRVLSAFKTRNSIDALSQIALYDLSANLRSKAVSVLTDFDHESVFETILLACADPTREVRAAAARGLFKLSFDRAEAWKRIIASKDTYRMSHTARAAIESGIAQKSFDRLVHYDMKIAYEAFALIGLLVHSGETSQIFQTIKSSSDENVKLALLHCLSVIKDDRLLPELNKLRIDASLPESILSRVKETVEAYHPVMA
ncbi:MAG TPA: hypothetical protein PKA82_16920 [Pyrinomonadaceae bacterium]|nr:hypothetical protein [Pyrinomonadaceae bacterium]